LTFVKTLFGRVSAGLIGDNAFIILGDATGVEFAV